MMSPMDAHAAPAAGRGWAISASVLKIIIGVVFIISSVSKLVSMEAFEMYVYSFGLFPLALNAYVARLVLVLEMILGAALISHRHHRFTLLMTLHSLSSLLLPISRAVPTAAIVLANCCRSTLSSPSSRMRFSSRCRSLSSSLPTTVGRRAGGLCCLSTC